MINHKFRTTKHEKLSCNDYKKKKNISSQYQ